MFERSIASQVEHRARIGRAVEQALGHDQVGLGGPRYSVDPTRRGGIVRIDADGSRTRGRFVRRRFVG